MAFGDPVVGGLTLIREAIQSPDYVPGVSGWRIARDGSSEFNNGTFRGEVDVIDPVTSTEVTISATAFGAAVLLSPPPIAGHTIAAGAVYTGSTVGTPDTTTLLLEAPNFTGHTVDSSAINLIGRSTSGSPDSLAVIVADRVLVAAPANNTGPIPLLVTQPGAPATIETWHPVTLANGFTANAGEVPQYRLIASPPYGLQVVGWFVSGGVTGGGTTIGTVPAVYAPALTQTILPVLNATTNACLWLQLTGGGQLQLHGPWAAGANIMVNGIFPLDM